MKSRRRIIFPGLGSTRDLGAIKTGICDQRNGAQLSICVAAIQCGVCRLGVKTRSYRIATLVAGFISISGHSLTRRNTVSRGTGPLPDSALGHPSPLPSAHPPDAGSEEDAIEGWTRTLTVVKTQFLALPTKSAPYLSS